MIILLVEENQSLSQETCTCLERLGFAVLRCSSLEDAEAEISSKGIDAIVLDLACPHEAGMDLFRNIRALAPEQPIIIASDRDDHELAIEYIKGGAQDYLIRGIAGDESVRRCLLYAVERHRVETRLRKGEEHLRVILDNSYDAFISMDSQWRIIDWNVQAERTFGWTREDALRQTLDCIIPKHLRRQYAQAIKDYFVQNHGKLLKASTELTAIRKGGGEFPIEIGIFRVEERSGYKFCAFVRDITDRKRSNEELMRLVQERTEKLTSSNEELRQFAKVASHDLQEPLRAVEGFANLLAQAAKDKLETNCLEYIDYILDGVARMQQLIKSVLLHSQIKSDDSIRHSTNCNSVIDEILVDLHDEITETNTSIEVDRLPKVAVERSQVVQLFQNLIGNSIKYRSENPPQIHISAERNLDL